MVILTLHQQCQSGQFAGKPGGSMNIYSVVFANPAISNLRKDSRLYYGAAARGLFSGEHECMSTGNFMLISL